MKRAVALLLLALPLRAADLTLTNGTRIVIAGDSIPNMMMWPHYITAYLHLMNPTLTLHVQTEARGGLTLVNMMDGSGETNEHYPRRIEAYEPDYVFIGGSTNGGYNGATYAGHMGTLITDYIVGDSGAIPVLVGVMPLARESGYANAIDYDDENETLAVAATPDYPFHKTYQAMDDVATRNIVFTCNGTTDVLTSAGHGYADGTKVLAEFSTPPTGLSSDTIYYVRDATTDTFKLATSVGGAAIDFTGNGSGTHRISDTWSRWRKATTLTDDDHAGQGAQIAYASFLITGLGWTTAVSSATVNASNYTVTSETQCDVASVTTNAYGGIDFTRLDNRLPWAVDAVGREDAEYLFPGSTTPQTYTLTVTGLSAGTYDVLINGVDVDDLTHTELAAGWNMAALTSGPVYDKGIEVLGLIRDMHSVNRAFPHGNLHPVRVGVEDYRGDVDYAYQTEDKRGADLINDTEVQAALHTTALENIDYLDSLIKAEAQPETLTFSLRLQGYTPAALTTGTLNVIGNLNVGP